MMGFPSYRPRRMRATQVTRSLIRETSLSASDFIYPVFVKPEKERCDEIPSMPGVFQYSVDRLPQLIDDLMEEGIEAVILFGLPSHKDARGSEAYDEHGIVQEAIRAIKAHAPSFFVITDVCLCEYTDHGHCGVIDAGGAVDNDETLTLLAREALSHVEAGADMVAPSDMMDGHVKAIRTVLDEHGFSHLPIMSYAVKYASGFYGPFRDAADSQPQFGDRQSYQMDPANFEEALREAALDIDEGADMIMVKPSLAYLDVLYEVKRRFSFPVVAYNVSGEYAMVKAAGAQGWIDEKRVILENLLCMKRAGADAIITYHAREAARWLR